jgi:hypothetical protein
MPGIDFDRLRREITMEEVLKLVGFEPRYRKGDQWYGRCPLHEATAERSHAFSVNVAIRGYCCHKCDRQGNQLDLWAAFTRRPLYPASIDLCRALGREVPWLHRW